MAFGAGTHVFPDANHRTWMTTFTVAAMDLHLDVSLTNEDARAMVVGSKVLRDEFRREHERYWTIAELSDAEHPYREFFRGYEGKLLIDPLED